MRIKQKTRFIRGTTNLVGRNFHYSDSYGFLHSYAEIFEEQVYKFKSSTTEPVIIDCGANIGLSILYFKMIFPESKIVGFEPDSDIFELLELNLHDYKGIELHNAAVWYENTELSFFAEGSLAGSTSLDFAQKNNIKNVTAIDLNNYLGRSIDFLKIDIEGAENDVIFRIRKNLKNVKNMFLEYHEIPDRNQNLHDILKLLNEEGFEYYIRSAADVMRFPFCNEKPKRFAQQLNIFCFRRNR